MSAPATMLARATRYLADRRRLGFALRGAGTQTLSFARFADAEGHQGALKADVVLRWAKHGATRADPFTWAQRVQVLHPFARHLAETEPDTTFPLGTPFGRPARRLPPHIYTPSELAAIMAAARSMSPRFGAGASVLPAVLGLLSATGLRISEALRLRCGDLDDKVTRITVRHSKFDRSRIVPLHATTTAALHRHLRARAKLGPMDRAAPLYLDELSGRALAYMAVATAWCRLRAGIGVVPRGGHSSIRIHDLRHTFICRRLMAWHAEGQDIDNAMLALSTYVGHARITDTYWYLQAVPELMALAGERFETFAAGEAYHG